MHTFWEIVASNALLVTALALGVALLGRVWKNPAGLHLLWMLVLLKLFTPPIITIGVPLPVDRAAPSPKPPEADNGRAHPPVVEAPAEQLAAVPVGAPPVHVSENAAIPRSTGPAVGAAAAAVEPRTLSWPTMLAWTWGIGVVVFASGNVYRMRRFQKLFRRAEASPAAVCGMAERIAKRLGLRRVPEVLMLPVRLSPLVWCVGGRPRVILPAELFARLDPDGREAILVHELAHVRRRDHLVRLLETLATTLFWWHPVVWWACGRLRELEEQCCDAAALRAVPQGARTYATALVDTLDFLSERPAAVPLAATAARSTRSIARRIEMLEQSRVNRLTAGSALVVVLVALVPMALALAAEAPRAEQGEPPSGGDRSEGLSVERIEGVRAREPGACVVTLSVDVPKGRRFRVTLREVPTRIYAPASFVFENERDEPALVQIRLAYLVEHTGDKSRDVLLSEEKLLQYDAKAEGCYPGGLTTITGVPLGNLARSEKKLTFVPPDGELSKAESGVRVLLITPKEANPRTFEDVEQLEPRGELIVSLEPMPDKTRKPDSVEQLRRAWARNTSAIGTAYIKYRRHQVGPSAVKRIPRESVDSLLSSFGAESPPEKVLPVVREVLGADSQKRWSSDWGSHVLRSVGPKTFHTYVYEGKLSSARFYDREIDVLYRPAGDQVDVYRAGDSVVARTTLNDFRISAPLRAVPESETSLLEDGRVRLSNDRLEIVADPSTGLVHRCVLWHQNGHVQAESLQYGSASYPGGIHYPRLTLHFEYRNGKLYSADVIVIDEARFNEGFANADFALRLPAGTKVVDYREDTFRPAYHRLAHDVDDAGQYFQPSGIDKRGNADSDEQEGRLVAPKPYRHRILAEGYEPAVGNSIPFAEGEVTAKSKPERQEQAAEPAVATAVLVLPSEIGVEPADRLPEGSAVDVTELLRRSHHVGLVIVDPLVSAPQDPWKQRAFLYRMDSIKGELARDPATNELPWVYGGLEGHTRYPTWYPQKAEYLAFLRDSKEGRRKALTTLAAFPVQYQPDETGRVVGKVVAGRNRKETLDVLQARRALETIVKGGTLSAEAREAVEAFFQAAVVPAGASSEPAPIPFEERFRDAKQLAASIKMGTPRKDIDKLFPQQDGGLSGPGSQRYYLGSEVMVEVPFDQTGGAWKPENRVNGAVRVYRSLMHFD